VAKRFRSLVAKDKRHFERNVKRVHVLCRDSGTLAFPLCAVTYANFVASGKLVPHEVAREANQLKFFDTSEDVQADNGQIVFISHRACQTPCYPEAKTSANHRCRSPCPLMLPLLPLQAEWKTSPANLVSEPDPTAADFGAIVAAIDSLIASGRASAERLFVWIDVSTCARTDWPLAPQACCAAHTRRHERTRAPLGQQAVLVGGDLLMRSTLPFHSGRRRASDYQSPRYPRTQP
jgi:hypothetical protein